ncbi:YciI family protein [Leifsonia sp. NPDC058292]|uniref:YciI family protein n=1 Tax=Leifsonia sp. NPDC058292 TaxID=3346428 RepID=UPI0036D8EA56
MSDEYVILIHEPEWDPSTMTAEQWEAGMAGHRAFQEAVAAAGERLVVSNALQGEAAATKITPSAGGAPVFTDGPFGETREVVTGLYVFTAQSPQQAKELAALVPTDGWLGLHPVLVLDTVK